MIFCELKFARISIKNRLRYHFFDSKSGFFYYIYLCVFVLR